MSTMRESQQLGEEEQKVHARSRKRKHMTIRMITRRRARRKKERLGGESRVLLPPMLFLPASVNLRAGSGDQRLQLFILEEAPYLLRRTDHFSSDNEDRQLGNRSQTCQHWDKNDLVLSSVDVDYCWFWPEVETRKDGFNLPRRRGEMLTGAGLILEEARSLDGQYLCVQEYGVPGPHVFNHSSKLIGRPWTVDVKVKHELRIERECRINGMGNDILW